MSELLPVELADRYDPDQMHRDPYDGTVTARLCDMETGQSAFLRAGDPDRRFQTAGAMGQALTEFLADHPGFETELQAREAA